MNRENDHEYARPGARDERQIEFDDPAEILYWVKYFDTTKDELLSAVSAVGTSASAAGIYLRGKRAPSLSGGRTGPPGAIQPRGGRILEVRQPRRRPPL